jgi:hypothetical protein
MNTNTIVKTSIAALVIAAGLFGLSKVETNLPLVSISLSYLAVAAIFGLAAGDNRAAKRLS